MFFHFEPSILRSIFECDCVSSLPQVTIFSIGNRWRTLWLPCLTLPPAQGLRLFAWAASTCWCSCLSPVPCSSWPPGPASHFTAANCKGSRPWGSRPSTATSSMSRPYEQSEADRSCTQTLLNNHFYCPLEDDEAETCSDSFVVQ